ncbi:hypothetical protein GCM10022198_13290 [Klugiella xanthotipulae]|uniref:Uncharacterized protein n=1 Tax=Klugiella xanthotipulae TaxID=244735 RepID=A0A543I4B6_9MICO|nr:hypothetical protein [Klugiella xanthotipulae]TQM65415.1 hypothetical protein FB466_0217 [Klugiella xanthotipulae]
MSPTSVSPADPTPEPARNSSLNTDTEALDPFAMLALADNQQRSIEQQMGSFVPALALIWAVAWSVGFTMLWLIDGLAPKFSLPLPAAIITFASLILVAAGLSTWMSIRANRGIKSSAESAFTGIIYGAMWAAGSIAIIVFGYGLEANGMSAELATIYYPTAFVLFAGIMYVMAGAIWSESFSAVTGGLLMVLAVVGPFCGYPNHYLWFGLAGGGTFALLALVSFIRLRRVRALAEGGGRHG